MSKATPARPKLTEAQREAVDHLKAYGEAILRGWYYESQGWHIADAKVMKRLAGFGLVKIETVGQSTFANLTARGYDAQPNSFPA